MAHELNDRTKSEEAAWRASTCLELHSRLMQADPEAVEEERVSDLLLDLRAFCESRGISFEEAVSMSANIESLLAS